MSSGPFVDLLLSLSRDRAFFLISSHLILLLLFSSPLFFLFSHLSFFIDRRLFHSFSFLQSKEQLFYFVGSFFAPKGLFSLSSLVAFLWEHSHSLSLLFSDTQSPLFCFFQLPTNPNPLAIIAGFHRQTRFCDEYCDRSCDRYCAQRIRACPALAFLCRGRPNVPPIASLPYRPVPSITLICALLPCSSWVYFLDLRADNENSPFMRNVSTVDDFDKALHDYILGPYVEKK